jgi:rare lipoprotein A
VSATPSALAPPKTAIATRTDTLHGIASWYGSVLNGHLTASGERFDMYAMTACHPTLPFGSLVRVVDQTTKRSVIVRINDRGILSQGRIIDLSYAAAQELKMTKAGLAQVDVEVISLGHRHHRK